MYEQVYFQQYEWTLRTIETIKTLQKPRNAYSVFCGFRIEL